MATKTAGIGNMERERAALVELGRALRAGGYDFTTVSPATHARIVSRPERAEARDLRDVFGWSRPFRQGLVPAPLLALMDEGGVLDADGPLMRSRVRASTLAGELFVHSAYPTQAADSVFFGPDTYRFGSAILAWLDRHGADRIRRVADVGAGAGPGGILVARAAPDAAIVLLDINEGALALSRVNAAIAGTGRVEARRSDLLSGVEGAFDLVVSNPPYLNDPLARAYRHGGGPLGAALSGAILVASLDRLAPGGTLLLYTGVAIVNGVDPFRRDAAETLGRLNVEWSYREVDPDVFGEELDSPAYARADRIAAVVLEATRKD